ncbi:MAG: response regulator [Candidatus Acidiferrales bacterium]
MPKILVAEDDRLLAQYYVTLLSQWDCETALEHRGTDAIRRAVTFRPDVALLGVVIPEMGGVEAAVKLLGICPGTKIILVTESVPPEKLEQLAAQGYHFPTLPVPFSREELYDLVFGDAEREVSEGG